jgi:CRP/FNR family transcriptional regulator, cyclic AMP receptor protein
MTTTINLFRQARSVKRFAAGEVIFSEGQPGDVMYIVLEGQVAIEQGQRLLALVGPDEVLGELALIDHGPHSASAVARSACILAPITEQHFLFMVQQTPLFALQVMRVLAERLRATIDVDGTLLPVETR